MTEGAMGLSAADVAAVTRNNEYDGFGNGGWIWIILLAFLFRGNWGRIRWVRRRKPAGV